jgi:hypothetical protein
MKLFLSSGNRQDNYIHADQQRFNMTTILLSLSLSALLILSFGFSFQSTTVFAQVVLLRTSNNNIVKNNFASSAQQVVANHVTSISAGTSNITEQPPLITKISSKGVYQVQLSWSTPISIQSLPKNGFSPHILFMNATAPPATSKTIPNRAAESEQTAGIGTQYNVPGSIERIVPINSFDMTIYDNHGKILWNKVKQTVSAGLGLEQVVFPKGYTGNITILIHNIKSPLHKVPTDSVEFAAKVG